MQTGKKIESPLAKYNAAGQLTCIVCNQVVKSEALWNTHINTKAHLENKDKLKSKLKSASGSSGDGGFKKPESVAAKKAPEASNNVGQKRHLDEKDSIEVKKQRMDKIINKTGGIDLNKIIQEAEAEEKPVEAKPAAAETENVPVSLPEGFFDDPELDAKARGTTRAETLEAEYEAFKKAMQIEEAKANTIVEKDEQASEIDRDLEEVDELIARWLEIENLHKKREALVKTVKTMPSQDADSDSEGSDVDLTDVLDMKLRNKKL